MDQVHPELNPCQYQKSPSTQTSPMKLPPLKKDYLCLQTDGRTAKATQCAESRALNKVIDTIIFIGLFEKKCGIIKGVV